MDRTQEVAGSSSATSGRPVARCSRSGPLVPLGLNRRANRHAAGPGHERPTVARSTRQMIATCGKTRTAARSCEGWPAGECRNHAKGAVTDKPTTTACCITYSLQRLAASARSAATGLYEYLRMRKVRRKALRGAKRLERERGHAPASSGG